MSWRNDGWKRVDELTMETRVGVGRNQEVCELQQIYQVSQRLLHMDIRDFHSFQKNHRSLSMIQERAAYIVFAGSTPTESNLDSRR